MDAFSLHLQPLGRRYPSELQVAHIGNMPDKSHLVRRGFSTYNFSFVFRGSGFYEWRGTRYRVRGPTVLRQWPAEPMHYGPQGTWHELYVVYSPTAMDTLTRRGYVTSDRPFWSIRDTRGMQHHLHDLSRLLSKPAALADQIDRIDRCCEQLILESLMGASRAARIAWRRCGAGSKPTGGTTTISMSLPGGMDSRRRTSEGSGNGASAYPPIDS